METKIKIGKVTDNSYLTENHLDETEIKAVIFIENDYWIFITDNPKGIFRFDDGYNTNYTNDYQDAMLMLHQFQLENFNI
jgi:hypothetical protein